MSEQNCSCPPLTSPDAGTVAAAVLALLEDADEEELPEPESEPHAARASTAAVAHGTTAERRTRRPVICLAVPSVPGLTDICGLLAFHRAPERRGTRQ